MSRWSFALAIGLIVVSSSVQAELQLTNIEAVHGEYGPLREELSIYPQEELLFRFLVEGVSVDEQGRSDLELSRTILDSDGEVLASDATPTAGVLALGGSTMPGTASLAFGPDVTPGIYQLIIGAKDNLSGEEAEFRREVAVRPTEFAIVNPRFSYDEEGAIAAPVGGLLGQSLYFTLQAIGFDRTQGKLSLEMKVQLFDENSEPLMPQPIYAELASDDADVVAEVPHVTFSGQMALNRAGEFTIEVIVTDRISGEDVVFSAPFAVHNP